MKKGEGQSQPMEKQLYSEKKTIRKSTRPTKERKK